MRNTLKKMDELTYVELTVYLTRTDLRHWKM